MTNAAEYECIFGPDDNGEYIQENVLSNIALNCSDFCECVGFTNNICLFGPDENGSFVTYVDISSEEVDSCSR